jgi:geranylgeranyl diphosphate synthase type I
MAVLSCEAVGGAPQQAVPAAAALACLLLSIVLVDDMLDEDARGEYRRGGAPATANFAVALHAAGLETIGRSEAGATVKLAAIDSLNRMMLITAFGQHCDLQNPLDEEAYWRVVETKSSPFFSAALHVGALFGGASLETAEGLRRLGHLYGEMIQIHDDFNDAMTTPANPDWLQGRSSLPILFAQSVDHPERARFVELRRSPSDPGALAEAQAILVRSGAMSYCVDQIIQRYQKAQAMLNALSLPYHAGLQALLETQITPVLKLFDELGIAQPLAAPAVEG